MPKAEQGRKLAPRDRRANPVGHDPRRAARRVAAEGRAEARATRTAKEQIVLLGSRPGRSARERARLSGYGNGGPHPLASRMKA